MCMCLQLVCNLCVSNANCCTFCCEYTYTPFDCHRIGATAMGDYHNIDGASFCGYRWCEFDTCSAGQSTLTIGVHAGCHYA